MLQYLIHRTAILLIAAALLGLVLSCCHDDNPVKPAPATEYYAYFGDEEKPDTYFRYNTRTHEVDSFILPYNSLYDGFGISPDGKTMYLHPDDGIVEVSLDSFTVIAEHPINLPKGYISIPGHEVLISPDGQYIALLNRYLHLLRLSDMSVLYSDTSTLYIRGWFTDDGKSFFCVKRGVDRSTALRIKLDDSLEVNEYPYEDGSVSRIITSPDGDLWFLLLYIGSGIFRFQVRTMPADSLIFEKIMCPSGGDLVATRDGRLVAYSQPGSPLGWCPPHPYVNIFDVTANDIDREVNTFDDSLGVAFGIGELWISPDGTHLVGISARWSGLGHIFHYNLRTNTIEARFRLESGNYIFGLGGQRIQ